MIEGWDVAVTFNNDYTYVFDVKKAKKFKRHSVVNHDLITVELMNVHGNTGSLLKEYTPDTSQFPNKRIYLAQETKDGFNLYNKRDLQVFLKNKLTDETIYDSGSEYYKKYRRIRYNRNDIFVHVNMNDVEHLKIKRIELF